MLLFWRRISELRIKAVLRSELVWGIRAGIWCTYNWLYKTPFCSTNVGRIGMCRHTSVWNRNVNFGRKHVVFFVRKGNVKVSIFLHFIERYCMTRGSTRIRQWDDLHFILFISHSKMQGNSGCGKMCSVVQNLLRFRSRDKLWSRSIKKSEQNWSVF
jgi:hypothetical protein